MTDSWEIYEAHDGCPKRGNAGNAYEYFKHCFFNRLIYYVKNDWEKTFLYVKEAAYNYLNAYKKILVNRLEMSFNEKNKKW